MELQGIVFSPCLHRKGYHRAIVAEHGRREESVNGSVRVDCSCIAPVEIGQVDVNLEVLVDIAPFG